MRLLTQALHQQLLLHLLINIQSKEGSGGISINNGSGFQSRQTYLQECSVSQLVLQGTSPVAVQKLLLPLSGSLLCVRQMWMECWV
jgi:hypothetical protein